MYYTLGQRRGLGIGGLKGRAQDRWFVVGKDLETNHLIVSCGEDDRLFSRTLAASGINFIGPAPEAQVFDCTAKTRYRQPDAPCRVTMTSDSSATVEFASPMRAITPGQYVVFYIGSRCLGGGVIDGI